jgi:thiamine kinase-like enzyme
LDRFYWSLQWWDKDDPIGFCARTLHHAAKTGEVAFCDFPTDPYLTSISSRFGEMDRKTHRIDILRYIPLRRLTLRLIPLSQDEVSVIGKFKRRSRLREAYDRLAAVYRAVARSEGSFFVAAPRGIDETHSLFFQQEMPGPDLASQLHSGNFRRLLRNLGSLHQALHCLKTEAVPLWDFSRFLEQLRDDIDWIIFFRPEHEPFLDDILNLLLRNAPDADPATYTFCHGDLVCSQILREAGRWSVLDFDLCRKGDPYLELGMLAASLKYDVPLFEGCIIDIHERVADLLEEGVEAYLEGYQKRAGETLCRRKLIWYRACSEIYYLALMFKKNRFHPEMFRYGVEQLNLLRQQI